MPFEVLFTSGGRLVVISDSYEDAGITAQFLVWQYVGQWLQVQRVARIGGGR